MIRTSMLPVVFIAAMAVFGAIGVSISHAEGHSGVPAVKALAKAEFRADQKASAAMETRKNPNGSRRAGFSASGAGLSEKYISPNGDGIKDTTQFSFQLSRMESVVVDVVDQNGRKVRTLSDPALEKTAEGNMTWDGRREDGMTAPDGRYDIRVSGETGIVLATASVILDNDRSTLADAVRADAVIDRDLSCMLPAIVEKAWLPDDSGLVVAVSGSDGRGGEYPSSLYFIASDGKDVRRLVPWNWQGYTAPAYAYTRFAISPDATKIAFVLKRSDKEADGEAAEQLWCTGIDGTHLTSLIADDPGGAGLCIDAIVWSPDGRQLAVKVRHPRTGGAALRIVTPDGALDRSVLPESLPALDIIDESLRWSPDGTRLAFAAARPGGGRIYAAAPEAAAWQLFDYSGRYHRLAWCDDGKLVLLTHEFGKSACRIIDAAGGGICREMMGFDAAEIAANPKAGVFAYIQKGLDVTVCDGSGDCRRLYESATPIEDLGWSADGRRLAFFSERYRKINPCIFESAFVVITPGEAGIAVMSAGYSVDTVDGDMYGGAFDRCGKPFADNNNDEFYRTHRFRYRYGSLRWVGDGGSLMAEEEDRGVLMLGLHPAAGPVYVTTAPIREMAASPHGRSLAYDNPGNVFPIVDGRKTKKHLRTMRSRLNLTADLEAVKGSRKVELKGIADDLHFDRYVLEYADAGNPDLWREIHPPSKVRLAGGTFTEWVPPHEGVFFVRLVVMDLAGNRAQDLVRVSWGSCPDISGIYPVGGLFSPNGDGVMDAVELCYRVGEPAHLECAIINENGKRIRTFHRDYAAVPLEGLEDHIRWDGRDETGRVAPDGIYRMTAADAEFFFEIDTTPPKIGIGLDRLSDQFEKYDRLDIDNLTLSLTGHAHDRHLKRWTIAWGEGENPSEWFEYRRGKGSIPEDVFDPDRTDRSYRSHRGDASTPISQFCSDRGQCKEDISFVTGKRFRITAEDFAGNRRVAQSGFSDEVLLLAAWEVPEALRDRYNGQDVYDVAWTGRPASDAFCDAAAGGLNRIPPELAAPGIHRLSVFHTIRNPIAALTLQYGELKDPVETAADQVMMENIAWSDHTTVADPATRDDMIDISLDNSDLPGRPPVIAVRLKAVAATGETHYSFPVITADLFGIFPCEEKEWGDLPPDYPQPSANVRGYCSNMPLGPDVQKRLTFSWKRIEESDGRWREYLRYDAEAGDRVPIGVFPIPEPPDEDLPPVFDIRMVSEIVSETGRISICRVTAAVDCSDPTVIVRYPEAKTCGGAPPGIFDVSGGRIIGGKPVVVPNFGFQPGRLTSVGLYLDENGESRRLSHINLVSDRLDLLRVDAGDVEEGLHTIKAVFEMPSPGDASRPALSRKEVTGSLIVDRTPPEARITAPAGMLRFCPRWVQEEAGGGWYAVDIEGVAVDNIGVGRTELWYGPGEDPMAWQPALIRTAPVPHPETERRLGIWDVTGLAGGEIYTLKLLVMDLTGNVSCHTTTFTMGQRVRLQASCSMQLFSPNGDGFLDSVDVVWESPETAAVGIRVLQGDRLVKTLVSGERYDAGTGSVVWDGTDDTGVTVADGRYTVRVQATDVCGNVIEKTLPEIEVDNTPPALEISYPPPGGVRGKVVAASGTASDPHFLSYRLFEQESGELLGSGNQSRENGMLGRWNTFGKEGARTLILSAKDTLGNVSEIRTVVVIADRRDLIARFTADPVVISPNGDARLETADIRYTIEEVCGTTLEILRKDTVLKRIVHEKVLPGEYGLVWDGKDEDGNTAVDGPVRLVLTARLATDDTVTQQETAALTLDTKPPNVTLVYPKNHTYTRDPSLLIRGSIHDPTLNAYTMFLEGQIGKTVVAAGTENREDYVFAAIDQLPDGKYTLIVEAVDRGKNETRTTRTFAVDRFPPAVDLESPPAGTVYGGTMDVVPIFGSAADDHLSVRTIRWGPGVEPESWTVLPADDAPIDEPVRMVLKVGKSEGIPDGLYTVSIVAADRAGWSSEARAVMIVDNTPPEIRIRPFGESGVVREPGQVRGTVADPHLESVRVDYAPGCCGSSSESSEWKPMPAAGDTDDLDVLAAFDVLPSDGPCCLRVTAQDTVGNRSAVTQEFTVDARRSFPQTVSQADLPEGAGGGDDVFTGMENADNDGPAVCCLENPAAAPSAGVGNGDEIAGKRPVVNAVKKIGSPVNLLVWINISRDKCLLPGDQECDDGVRFDLPAPLLEKETDGWNIVYDREDFAAELKNPIYSDILIVGERCRLSKSIEDELARKIFQGTGLISSRWRPPWLTEGAVTSAYGKGVIAFIGLAPEPKIGEEAADLTEDIPADAIPMEAIPVADILAASIERVHRKDPPEVFFPGMLIPISLSLEHLEENSEKDVTVRITEHFPEGFELYDPAVGAWTMESPWSITVRPTGGQTRKLTYYLRAPAACGGYSAETELRIGNDMMILNDMNDVCTKPLKLEFLVAPRSTISQDGTPRSR